MSDIVLLDSDGARALLGALRRGSAGLRCRSGSAI